MVVDNYSFRVYNITCGSVFFDEKRMRKQVERGTKYYCEKIFLRFERNRDY